jgi:hypothetical protein
MRKLVTRYTGDKGTAHHTIGNGSNGARTGYVYVVFTTGLHKGYALEIPTSELKYRGKPVDQLPESEWLSADR